MLSHLACRLALSDALLGLVAGCSAEYFRSETVLHSDGQVERSIYQPAERTDDDVQNSDAWSRTTYAPEIAPDDWHTRIAALPQLEPDEQRSYFAATGRFPSIEAIPRHYVRRSPDGSREAGLEREAARNDYVFIVEHVWHETLTDIVTIEDMQLARRELAALMIDVVRDVLDEGLGEDYDASRLIAWLRNEGTVWFSELTDVYYDAAARRQFDRSDLVRGRFEAVCARHGLPGVDNSAVEAFAAAKLRELLRTRDGGPPADGVVEAILLWLKIREPATIDGQPQPSPLDAVAEKVIESKYGGREAFERRVAALVVRIVGLYGPLQTAEEFYYTLTVPGEIVETNGTLLADNRVEWTFRAAEAYPLGRPMTCRSLELKSEPYERLLKHKPLASRAARLAFVRLLKNEPGLLDVLGQCEKAGSLQPLHEHRDGVELEEDEGKIKSVRTLWKILQLPI